MNGARPINRNAFEKRELSLGGTTIRYRALEGVPYCSNPLDPIQVLNVYAHEAYFEGSQVGPYDRDSAPVFLPNTVGGYLPGPAEKPGEGRFFPTNAAFDALAHGYVVVGIGVRGRTTGKASNEFFEGSTAQTMSEATGRMVGRAPAFVVDEKAGIRFLRHHAEELPGDFERIVTNGTSAGGALSALAGASGNSHDYDPYLERIGAVMSERDDIFAASCYCPIHNLEHADMAYEWQFRGIADYHVTHFRKRDGKVVKISDDGILDASHMELANELATLFPDYVNSLGLRDDRGEMLSLDAEGKGSFLEWVKRWVVASAQSELATHDSERRLAHVMTEGAEVASQTYLSIADGKVNDLDWPAFNRAITRMKPAPAFDGLALEKPENEEFGDESVDARHFTAFSQEHDAAGGELASERMIHLMNPLSYVDNPGCTKHWRIRHGSYDRDTSLAIPVILATTLVNAGLDVDFALPWGLPHSGDYDVADLFAWIDSLCA